ncbi:MAG TPA: ABC transporter permease subunit [Candidatus Methanofastidiosa archaeon]|nr:ABC transporter permease subunit [Candidatus Methanofastidiosa archaeon]HPR41440.1 ABC transporter permease subunit [Candidatus Methanofastidiosa archaeon]
MNRFSAKYGPWKGQSTTFRKRMSTFITHELSSILRSKWSLLVLIIIYALLVMPRIFAAMNPIIGFSPESYYSMFSEMHLFIFLYAAVVGSGIIASDFKNKSIVLYLTKGYSRFGYIVGKFAILFLAFSLITILPFLIIYIVALISSDLSFAVLKDNLWLLGAGLAMGTVLTLFLCALTAGLSALLGDRRYTGAALFAVMILSGIVSDILFSINGNEMMWMVSLGEDISVIGTYLFRLDGIYGFNRAYPFMIIVAISLVMAYIVYHYIYRKELST